MNDESKEAPITDEEREAINGLPDEVFDRILRDVNKSGGVRGHDRDAARVIRHP